MRPRQTGIPTQWLVVDARLGSGLWHAVRALPRGSGILVVNLQLSKRRRAKLLMELRRAARSRNLTIVDEAAGGAVRVHDLGELRVAGTARAKLVFLSPLFATRSHPGRKPLPRMRAGTLARLAKAPVIALGGMNERRFRQIEGLGFAGWAGIDAWKRG